MTDARPSLYAMYLQATRFNPNSMKTMRRQWIVLPPLPLETAARFGLAGNEEYLLFFREQTNPENRVKWRPRHVGDSVITEELPDQVAQMKHTNTLVSDAERWNVSPVITAQVTPKELSDLHQHPVTPYVILRRFEKVAAKRHGLSI